MNSAGNGAVSGWGARDLAIIKAALDIAVTGPFFPDWEFGTLLGFSREDVAAIAQRWPNGFPAQDDVRRAAIATMNNLLGYPHDLMDDVTKMTGASECELRDVLDRLVASAAPETTEPTAAPPAQE